MENGGWKEPCLASLSILPSSDFHPPSLPFPDVIAHELGKLIGEIIPKQAMDLEGLPPYLRMNFRITDQAGKVVAVGRDLLAIRAKLGIKARESFAALPPPEFTRDGLTRWDFGDLPERIEIHRDGATFSGFPALIDQEKSVALRVLDSREASKQATRGGVRRLLMIQLDQEMKQLGHSRIAGRLEKMGGCNTNRWAVGRN